MTAPDNDKPTETATPRARKRRISIDRQHPTRLQVEPLVPLEATGGEDLPAVTEPTPPPARAGKAAALPSLPSKPRRGEPINWTYYRADSTRHVTQVGPIALGNFIGYVEGVPVRVHFGAPASTLPQLVRQAMADAGVAIGELPRRDKQGKPQRPTAALLGMV